MIEGVRVIFILQNLWYKVHCSERKLISWGIIFKMSACGNEANKRVISLMENTMFCQIFLLIICSFQVHLECVLSRDLKAPV